MVVSDSFDGTVPRATLAALRKIDLHRHMEGSVRLTTLAELAHTPGLNLPAQNTAELRPLVTVTGNEPYTFQNFLSKFGVLRNFYQTPEAVQRVAYEAVADAAADRVKYLELRFTPAALAKARGYSLDEVTGWVLSATRKAARDHGLTVRLIASMNRNESLQLGEEVTRIAVERREDGIVGLDLAGDEVNYPAETFAGLFREARQAGLGITIHAGEWTGASTVRHAIETMGTSRIGHGVRVMEDPEVVALARERGVVFEVCPTSNLQSGVIQRLSEHPLREMLNAGLLVTINTDDPGISSITLTDEFQVVVNAMGIPLATLKQVILNAAEAAFLPAAERARMIAELRLF